MTWIKTIKYDDADGKLKALYDKIKGKGNYIDNILLVHSLRPHTLRGHMALYKNVLHHPDNLLPKWFLEAIGVYVSLLNGCEYCVRHHSRGMARYINDEQVTADIIEALDNDAPDIYFTGKELAILDYVRLLTLEPHKITRKAVSLLQVTGIPDEEILEINQVVGYFAYANRTVLGLGVDTEGEVIGLSPDDDDADNWRHQ
jgi:uncharacterized peroxidase-related enzyme